MHAHNRGFSGSANLMVSVKLSQTTPVAIVMKTYRILTENCYNLACRRDMSPILAPNRVFWVGEFNYANKICITPTPVAKVTKIWKF